jgi:hypothetical protein
MNNSIRIYSRPTLAAMAITIASMSMVSLAYSEETAQSDEVRASVADTPRFCYQRDEMVSCEHAAKTQQEPQDQGKVSVPPRMFDLDVLLGGNPS